MQIDYVNEDLRVVPHSAENTREDGMSTPGARVSERIPMEEVDMTETTKDMFSPSAHIVENEEERIEKLEELREQVGTQNDGSLVMINDESRAQPENV